MSQPTYTFIYGLKDPRDRALRYIGKANDPQDRLYRHIRFVESDPNEGKKEWILEFLDLDLEPVMWIIMRVPYSRWRKIEREAIRRYREAGCDLLNIAPGGLGFDWSCDPEWRSEITKEMWKRPDYRRKMDKVAQANSEREIGEEELARRSASAKKMWQNPGYRTRQIESRHNQRPPTVETKAKISTTLKHLWQDPEFRESSIEASQNPTSKAKRSESMKRTCARKREQRQKRRGQLELWPKK